jgi:hypothetical protein
MVIVAACSSGESVAKIGESCFVNSDCSNPLVCVFRTCHIQCRADADCRKAVDEQSLCQRGSQPQNVCQNKEERACTTQASCAPGQVCGVDARCRDQCQADRDCVEGQVCTQGACANPDELRDGKLPVVLEGGPSGSPCAYNSDCPDGTVCVSGICKVQCHVDLDCDVDQCCTPSQRCALRAFRDNQCLPLADAGSGQEANDGGDAARSSEGGEGGAADVSMGAADAGMDASDTSIGSGDATSEAGDAATDVDNAAPVVMSVSPSDGAINVDVAAPLQVVFSKAVDPATVTPATFVLRAGAITVAANVTVSNEGATLTPLEPLALNARYTVELTTDVTDTAHNHLASPRTWSFTTRDGQWASPARLSAKNVGDWQMAMAANGTGALAWTEGVGVTAHAVLRASRFDAGQWSTPVAVDDQVPGYAHDPKVATDSLGNAWILWTQTDTGQSVVWARQLTSAGLQAAGLVHPPNIVASSPRIAVSPNGNAVAAWQQPAVRSNGIWASTRQSGQWTQPLAIALDDAASSPELKIDDQGHAIAVWLQTEGSSYGVRASRLDAGQWSSGARIDTAGDAGAAAQPQLAMNGSGNAVAVWQQVDSMIGNIWSSRFEASAWGKAELLSTNDPRYADIPAVAMNVQGSALALWEQFESGVTLWTTRLDGAWGIPQLVGGELASGPSPQTGPRVALDDNGNAVAVWFDKGTTNDTIWATRLSAGTWGARRQIGNDGTIDAMSPQVAVDARGNALVIWLEYQSYPNGSSLWWTYFH